MIRQPAVANQFYPGNQQSLNQEVSARMKEGQEREKVLAVVSPHAGYVYSGNVAGSVFSVAEIPEHAIVLGPNHHGLGALYAVMTHGTWQMPAGNLHINEELASLLIQESHYLEADTEAHIHEHSIEVQLPFLQYVRAEIEFVPIVLSRADYSICEEIGTAIARALNSYGKPTLLVASTDMTHYESHQSARQKDQMAIDRIESLDPPGLLDTVTSNNISMCGVIPTTITLIAAKELGATKARLIQYATSGDVSGDYSYVVGYAGFIIQ